MFFLAPEGTRVLVLSTRKGGVIMETRHESFLKPYVVLCDDGTRMFASAFQLAKEGDPADEPLGPPLHD